MLPAICSGFGHALLFPAVVSLGTEAFPREYRGTGTTLVLGFFDLGGALSAPILGYIIDRYNGAGFSQMYFSAAAASVVVAVGYSLTGLKRPDSDLARISFSPSVQNVLPEQFPQIAANADEFPAVSDGTLLVKTIDTNST